MKNFHSLLFAIVVAGMSGCGELSRSESDPASESELIDVASGGNSIATEISFEDTELGGSATRSVVLVNRGRATTGPLSVTLSGSSPGDFAVATSSTCPGQRLRRDERCQLDLVFAPRELGERTAALGVSATPGGTVTLTLRGRAVSPPDQLAIVIAGGGLGEVRVGDARTFEEIAVCTASCLVPVTRGRELEISASTVSTYGGLSGACASTDSRCTFTAPAGTSTVTATFETAPRERWTVLLGPGTISTAAYDGAGNLVVGANGITKLSPLGAVVWSVPIAACVLAIGPADTIYAQTSAQVVKLDADGATLWSQPLHPHAIGGCGSFDGFVHNLAVGVDGAVAIHGDTGVARWDADGNLTWAIAVQSDGVYAVAIDRAGNVGVGVLDRFSFEKINMLRFAADGTPLEPLEEVGSQAHGMFVFDANDDLLATASGRSHTDLSAGALSTSVTIPDADYAPSGVCSSGTGDVGWLYQLDDSSSFARDWVVNRYRNGVLVWTLSRAIVRNGVIGEVGTVPMDIAIDAAGNLAIVGRYTGVASSGGWIQTFGP
jgi:hypothetical protein